MTTLGFTGDISFSKYMTGAWQSDDLLSPEIVQYLSETDCTIPNVECALYNGKTVGTGAFNHASDPRCIPWLLKINGRVWNIANNHILDCGPEGLAATVAAAAENGCKTIGAGMTLTAAAAPAYFDNVGVFSVNYTPKYITDGDSPGTLGHENWDLIRENIEKIHQTCRWCVVVAHSGGEFDHLPLPTHRERFLKYLELGADVVVAHHPHVMQNYELFGENKAIFYSLGNFIFDTDYQRRQKNTDRGMLIRLHFDGDRFRFDHMAVRIDRENHRVVPGETPTIFRHIGPEDHERLWPLAARVFHLNQYAARENSKPAAREYTPAQWAEWEAHKRETDRAWLDVGPGEGLLCHERWKEAPAELSQYLLDSICDPE